jgi:hypothetical protein
MQKGEKNTPKLAIAQQDRVDRRWEKEPAKKRKEEKKEKERKLSTPQSSEAPGD